MLVKGRERTTRKGKERTATKQWPVTEMGDADMTWVPSSIPQNSGVRGKLGDLTNSSKNHSQWIVWKEDGNKESSKHTVFKHLWKIKDLGKISCFLYNCLGGQHLALDYKQAALGQPTTLVCPCLYAMPCPFPGAFPFRLGLASSQLRCKRKASVQTCLLVIERSRRECGVLMSTVLFFFT